MQHRAFAVAIGGRLFGGCAGEMLRFVEKIISARARGGRANNIMFDRLGAWCSASGSLLRVLPLEWALSFLPRPLLKGQRLLHVMCPFWRCYFRGLVTKGFRETGFVWSHSAHAYLRGRRVEGAILSRNMRAGWCELGRFWKCSGVPKSLKRQIFIGKVIEAGQFASTAFAYTDAQHGEIDACACSLLRSLLRGEAHDETPEGKHTKWSNLEVLKKWRLLPSKWETALRRVKWLQSMAELPSSHRQVRAGLFGSCYLPGGFKNLDSSGRLSGGNPFSAAFAEALLVYDGLSGWEHFYVFWGDFGRSWKSLFIEPDVVDAFSRADAALLRQAFWTDAWKPEKLIVGQVLAKVKFQKFRRWLVDKGFELGTEKICVGVKRCETCS